jgi:membrane associated rhomboid family serine protease
MAFLRDGDRTERAFNVPASVMALIAALVAAHLVRVFLIPGDPMRLLTQYGFIPARAAQNFLNPGGFEQALPFVSYMFLHGDLTHLVVNCLWLLAFGPIVARRFGPVLFLLFFLICGVLAAAAYFGLNPSSSNPVIGASGAISGLMAAGIRLLRPPPLQLDHREELAPILTSRVLVFSLLWVGINLVFGPTGLTFGGETAQLAWQAHLGGYFAGLLLAGPFDWLARRTSSGGLSSA